MKQEKNVLVDKIDIILNNLKSTGDTKVLLKSDLLDEYINKIMLTKVLNVNLPLNTLTPSELFHICRLINSYQKRIDLDEFFTNEEINYAMENKMNKNIEISPIIKLKDVLYSNNANEEFWICKVTYKDIYNWVKNGMLVYNMASQREGVLRKVGREKIVVPYINEKSIEDIKNAMLENRFYSNMITFNVTPDYNNKIEYNEAEKILRIDSEMFEIAVIDGWHRISAIVSAIDKNKELQGELFLKITNNTIEKARQFILQESKSNAHNKEALEKYNPTNKITRFINNINNYQTRKSNVLYKRIDTEVNNPDTWIPFEQFKEGLLYAGFIDYLTITNSSDEIEAMEEFIVQFFNKFYEIAEKNNINPEVEKDNDDKLSDPTFIMGLLVTCFKYSKDRVIDKEAMDKFLKKYKNTTTKYTYDYPIKSKDKRNLITKFSRLLEVN